MWKDIVTTPERKLLAIEILKEVRECLSEESQLILKEIITDIALM